MLKVENQVIIRIKKAILFSSLLIFTEGYSADIDSSGFSQVSRHSKYLQIGSREFFPGSYIGLAAVEIFISDKFSFAPGLQCDYAKSETSRRLEFNQINTFRYYIKIHRRYLFNIHASLSYGYRQTEVYQYIKTYSHGFNAGVGPGLSYMPYRIFKKPNRVGFFLNVELYNYNTPSFYAPFSYMGLKYKFR